MELWIWLAALAAGVLVLLISLIVLASRSIILAKRLKPFMEHLAVFKRSAQQYPEAVKFFSDLAEAEEKPAKAHRRRKG